MTDLRNVLWIGGPPGAGKTTAASILARRHGLRLYSADTRTWLHRDRAIDVGNEAAIRWEHMRPEERIAVPDSDVLAMSLYVERGAMVVADVSALPAAPLVIAEGSGIRPGDVPAGAAAVWLLPSARMASERLRHRDGGTNRVYELMVGVVAADVEAARARALRLTDLAETVAALESLFAPQLARGPLAASIQERRALLREANLDIVEQVRGYYARPWAVGDAESVIRSFICECGDRACPAFTHATVGVAASQPVVAPGHQ